MKKILKRKWSMRCEGRDYARGVVCAAGISYLFYRSVWISMLGSILYGGIYVHIRQKQRKTEEQYEANLQFREGLYSLSAALGAGYAVENALGEACSDLELLYGKDSLMAAEFHHMERQLQLNQPIEKVFQDFSQRWQTEDIQHFVQILQTAKRTGGDLIAITRLTAKRIGEKIEIQREIHTMVSGKRMEARIMNVIPLGLIGYFWISSPGFLDCMYQSTGRIVMTVLLIVYVFAFRWSEAIVAIEV